ncbi:MAG: hypothetical protein U9N84_14740 [Actinomycetota bacterium]|nr:hypothetical protein [Actinomycetota bacterium]
MGQSINVTSKQLDGFCVFSTDRSISGQDGAGFGSVEEAAAGTDFPASLAERLFTSDPAIDHVYVASNDVIVRRAASWDTTSVDSASATISELFRFYEA